MTISKIDGNGNEHFSCCVKCSVDEKGICNGESIFLENNHIKQKWSIYKMKGAKITKTLAFGQSETLVPSEFEKWLSVNGYKEDEHMCKREK